MPCYWIYREVGKRLLEKGSPDHRYRRWIDTYGGEEFTEIVRAVLDLSDRLAPQLSDAERRRMARHFRTAATSECSGRGLAAGSVADLALSTSLLARFRAARHGQPIKEARKGGV